MSLSLGNALLGTTGLSTELGLSVGNGLAFLGFGGGFSPASLFAAGEPGAWYDPSDFSTLFQNSTGTTPVTAVEQPVGLMLDKSQGLVLGSELVVNGDFATDTVWTKGAGWTISGGAASCDGSAQFSQLQQTNVAPVGKWYLVSFTLISKGASVTNLRIVLGGLFVDQINVSSTGTYSGYFYNAGSSATFSIQTQAGTGAAFAVSIDNVSVKELFGNHAFQSTSASRPVVSARVNLLTKTEDFADVAWVYQFANRDSLTTAPDGTSTAQLVTFTSQFGNVRQLPVSLASGGAKSGIWIKRISGNTQIQLRGDNSGGLQYVTNINITNDWAFYSVSWTYDGSNPLTGFMLQDRNPSGQGQIAIWHPDFRVANDTALPAYQRVNTATDYDTTGFPIYLRFDGSDDSMATGTINPGSIDKAQVFAGVRRLQQSAVGIIAEFSADIGANNGAFTLNDRNSATYAGQSKGTISSGNVSPVGTYTAPITNVLTLLGDISADTVVFRANGGSQGVVVADQGTGNYLAYPLYIGRRGGTTLPFNGRLYSLIVRFGANLTEKQIDDTEVWVGAKTGLNLQKAVQATIYDRADDVVLDRAGEPIEQRI